ncbi:ABC transporter permease [Roseiconus nitratireducens]|uniref:ABC transporter permease n=1 Tax=Roseiconus nitratireducens TaxID=2605748 RepID=A0A5M6D3Z5_9BACT|nr:ABC transporter permease [Roseiconus nitratireducens]KAA5542228.1 ABC transporter permease [Roseiconus nitratireducens]
MNDSDPKLGAEASESNVLGGTSATLHAYPSLALDPDGEGFWARIDRWSERVTAWLNPILLKEARQSLKSKQFLVTFFCLLVASCAWTMMGIIFNAPDVYFLPTGDTMMIGYFLILSISLFAFVPLFAFRSLAAELDEGTYEMLAITRLSAWGIVTGKMNSSVLQMLIYFSAIVPCLAFCYLLRGIGLPTIALVIAIAFITALVLTAFALMLSTLAQGRTLQTFLLVGLIAVIGFVEFGCCGIVFSAVLTDQWSGTWFGFLSGFLMAGSFVVLFLAAASARIAPITENRSTRLRAILFGQQVLWIMMLSYATWTVDEVEIIQLGMMALGIFWFVVGVFTCGESVELSPRVRRGLPATYLTRMLFTWWMPGPGTGFMFVVSTALSGLIVMTGVGQIAEAWHVRRAPDTLSVYFAAMMAGYLLAYLGTVRLLAMPFLKRFGPSFIPPLAAALVVVFAAVIVPATVDVALHGEIQSDYTVVHAFDWMWTWDQALSSGGLSRVIALLILAVGVLILCVNLISLFREFRRRRIAIPTRVIQDREAAAAPDPV